MKKIVVLVCSMCYSIIGFAQGIARIGVADTTRKEPVTTFVSAGMVQNKPTGIIPQNYYALHMAFFCRQELKMQQIHVPISFRVGKIEQCNFLEQKPGYKQ